MNAEQIARQFYETHARLAPEGAALVHPGEPNAVTAAAAESPPASPSASAPGKLKKDAAAEEPTEVAIPPWPNATEEERALLTAIVQELLDRRVIRGMD